MREILFRGKRKENGKWIYGSLVPKETNSYADGFLIIDGALNYDELDYYQPSFSTYDVVSETVGQYTGLTDKNGNKIFEGDIVHCVSKFDSADMVVIFECGQFRMILVENYHEYQTNIGYYDINCFTKEVIGNIYDNPELLEEAEQE